MTEARPVTGRGERARQRVLDAAAELLDAGGLAAATVDAVNLRSGVSKATIYKYWPNRLCVAIDAFADRLEHGTQLPDEGSAEADLSEQTRRVARFYGSPTGRLLVELLAASLADADAAALMRTRLLDSRRHAVQELWARSVTGGDVRPDLDPDVALDVAFGPVMWRLLRSGAVTGDEAAALADAAWRGLASDPEPPAPRG
ncbi:TetR/AcrR family transcriptional regulator [Nocardioides anomalus]|uniref:TetR/AcrR family transcriptional regulator n=1 Tax=Nocardioides anomalus TaxID=2712223 RepID=A0A6G6WC28_9ACTN|nr:TetR/AcrR family transcriptional regulator [Nocardioides anomalus]QIG42769.1 TetR/AcrR family transcriptional regulator [Nocardioides anomalus]